MDGSHAAGVARIQVTDEQLLRYSRHILLDALGIEGQERILATHALIVGAGARRVAEGGRERCRAGRAAEPGRSP